MPRGIKHLSNAQRALLDELHTVHKEGVNARLTLKREIELAFQDKLKALDIQKSIKMNEALRAGVPKSVISETVSQKNWHTLTELFSLAANLLPVVPDREPILVSRISMTAKPANSVSPSERQLPLWGTYIIRDFEYGNRTWPLEVKGGFHMDASASFPAEVNGDKEVVDELLSTLVTNPSDGQIIDQHFRAYLTNRTADYKESK